MLNYENVAEPGRFEASTVIKAQLVFITYTSSFQILGEYYHQEATYN